MKRTPLALTALAAAALFALALLPAQQPVSADDHKGDSHEVLHEAMEKLTENYRSVRRQARDASKNADTADKLGEMISIALTAKGAIPETATNDEMKKMYRVTMNKLIITTAQAENAALQGDQDALFKLVREMNAVKGEGHEMFIPEDE